MSRPFQYELTRLSNTHELIADWLIANPGKGQMGKCAAAFGYTQSWLSTLIRQDAFRAMLQAKQGAVFQEVVIPMHEKLMGVADAGVMRLGEIVESTKDERLVREITRDSLQAMGYGASTKGPSVYVDQSTHNNLNVDSAALADARARRSKHYGVPDESSALPHDPAVEAETPQLPPDSEFAMGEAGELRPSHVNIPAKVYGEPEGGSEV